jgi:hypothetical protein
MWVCDKCGAIKLDAGEKCRVCSLGGNTSASAKASRDAIPIVEMPPYPEETPGPQAGMPRRFGIGTIMVITTFFALVFGLLKVLQVPPLVFVLVSGFILTVAACQALLFGGKNPRKASFIAGMAMYALAAAFTAFAGTGVRFPIEELLCGAFGAVVVGGPLGYAAGCLIAAIFLVRKEPNDGEATDEKNAPRKHVNLRTIAEKTSAE